MLLSPFVPTEILRIKPAEVYLSVPQRYGNYNFIGNRIAEGGEVDILLISGSNTHTGFDSNFIAEHLEKRLNREVHVLNFGASWYGAEVDLTRLADALTTIKPKIVLLPDADVGFYFPHELSRYVWRHPPKYQPAGLSIIERATLYGTAMLGAPNLTYAAIAKIWERPIRPDLRAYMQRYEDSSGYQAEPFGWLSHHNPDRENRLPYNPKDYTLPDIPLEATKFNGVEDENFEFRSYTYNKYQSAFISMMAEVAEEHGAQFAMVSMPTHFGPGYSKDEPAERAWVRLFSEGYERDWPTIGVSMRQLFPDLTFDEMKQYYSNETHLNDKGAQIFNLAIIPVLEQMLRNVR